MLSVKVREADLIQRDSISWAQVSGEQCVRVSPGVQQELACVQWEALHTH